jgi:hypothetical protein
MPAAASGQTNTLTMQDTDHTAGTLTMLHYGEQTPVLCSSACSRCTSRADNVVELSVSRSESASIDCFYSNSMLLVTVHNCQSQLLMQEHLASTHLHSLDLPI